MKASGQKVMYFSFLFIKKGPLSAHQITIREAPTVFSRLPTLMEADKPCPYYNLPYPKIHFTTMLKKINNKNLSIFNTNFNNQSPVKMT